MTCWVPTFLAASFPSRIQRRTVSGLRPTRRAASGTVNIVVYYNIDGDKTWRAGQDVPSHVRSDPGATEARLTLRPAWT